MLGGFCCGDREGELRWVLVCYFWGVGVSATVDEEEERTAFSNIPCFVSYLLRLQFLKDLLIVLENFYYFCIIIKYIRTEKLFLCFCSLLVFLSVGGRRNLTVPSVCISY